MAAWVERHVLVLLLASYVTASFWPAAGIALRSRSVAGFPATFLLLCALLLLAGLNLHRREIGLALSRPGRLAAGHLLLWACPCAAVLWLSRLPATLPNGAIVGLSLVGLMPSAASSVGWTQLSRANTALSLAMVAISTLLTPLLLGCLWHTEAATSSAFGLSLWIIPSVLVGVGIQWWVGTRRITQWRSSIRLGSAGILLLLSYANASLALPHLDDRVPIRVWITLGGGCLFVCSLSFFAGWLLARLLRDAPADGDALIYSLGMKNTGMALVLAGLWLRERPFSIVAIIAYTLVQHLLAAAFYTHGKRRVLTVSNWRTGDCRSANKQHGE